VLTKCTANFMSSDLAAESPDIFSRFPATMLTCPSSSGIAGSAKRAFSWLVASIRCPPYLLERLGHRVAILGYLGVDSWQGQGVSVVERPLSTNERTTQEINMRRALPRLVRF
jgi:hypothetical protein